MEVRFQKTCRNVAEAGLHLFGNDGTGDSTNIMKVRIPQFYDGLALEPMHIHEQSINLATRD
jgi:hypothetical protein